MLGGECTCGGSHLAFVVAFVGVALGDRRLGIAAHLAGARRLRRPASTRSSARSGQANRFRERAVPTCVRADRHCDVGETDALVGPVRMCAGGRSEMCVLPRSTFITTDVSDLPGWEARSRLADEGRLTPAYAAWLAIGSVSTACSAARSREACSFSRASGSRSSREIRASAFR